MLSRQPLAYRQVLVAGVSGCGAVASMSICPMCECATIPPPQVLSRGGAWEQRNELSDHQMGFHKRPVGKAPAVFIYISKTSMFFHTNICKSRKSLNQENASDGLVPTHVSS